LGISVIENVGNILSDNTANLPMVEYASADLSAFHFRFDSSIDADNGFDRRSQIERCAYLLTSLRDRLGDRWWELFVQERNSEIKDIVKSLIRISSESLDFARTVDFITKKVLNELEAKRNAHKQKKACRGHITGLKTFSHEHMVPGEWIFKAITDPTCKDSLGSLESLLDEFGFRALVFGRNKKVRGEKSPQSETTKLDEKEFRCTIPEPTTIVELKGLTLARIERRFYPILRYDAAGLVSELIPVSDRARSLLAAYTRFKHEYQRTSKG